MAVDLLRHRLVRVEFGEKPPEGVIPRARVLMKKDREAVVCRVLGAEDRRTALMRAEEDYTFERVLEPKEALEYDRAQEGEKQRVITAQQLAESMKLPIQFFASRVGWEGKTTSYFFTSEEPVDFRMFLKTLIAKTGGRIHLERVGARDRAKIIGGFGSCGQETCCSTFKIDLQTVPMDGVRDQGLMIKDNQKLLGLCGKLKCCLLYELPQYREMRKYLPHLRQGVQDSKGRKGRVLGLDILNQRVKVLLENDTIEMYDAAELGYPNKIEPLAFEMTDPE